MNIYMKKIPKILIIGNHGQVGCALEIHLQAFAQLIVLNRSVLNMLNLNELESFLFVNRNNFDMIINACAYTAVDKAEMERSTCFIINYKTIDIIASFCELHSKPYIHYSTDYIFDGTCKECIEDSTPNPINYYGYSKMLAEETVIKLSKYLIFRTTWVYDHRGNNFLLTMLKLAEQKKELRVINDQFGAPTWAHTIAAVTSSIVQKSFNDENVADHNEWWIKSSGVYNLTASGYTNWFDYANTIFDLKKIDIKLIPISSSEYLTVAKRPQYSILNTNKLRDTFNVILPEWHNSLNVCLGIMN